MKSLAIRLYALLVYVLFLAAFACFVLFVAGAGVPRTVDSGIPTGTPEAIAKDLGLIFFFGFAHSLMARRRFKKVWTAIIPAAAERSTYVLVASAQMLLLCWQWRPIVVPQLWSAAGAVGLALSALQALGWGIVLLSTFLIDHFELFGVRQGFGGTTTASFRTPLLYRWVRHPLYFGLLLALWSSPTMSAGHLLLATALTVYLLIGARYEERDLLRTFGERYRQYQIEVPMLLPIPRRRRTQALVGEFVSK
jgi:protein-S-isoprenylcysteine O-methyltransferase Ste14